MMIRFLWLLAWTNAADIKKWTVRINEELPIGRNIVDLRHELNYSPERIFSLMSSSDLFSLNPSGILSAKGRIDFESICVNSRDECTVELEVGVLPQEYYERIQLSIQISNKNDNLHYFSQPQYELSISENYPTNNRFDISALSAVDNDANAELTYRLSPVKSSPFKVEQSGARLFLLADSKLDREAKSEYESRLIATDRDGQSVETKVVIKLRDENDNAPKFTQPPKEVNFDESKPSGSLIARVYAEDADHGHNAELEYNIIDYEPPIAKNLFKIEQYSGRIINTKLLKGHQLERVKLTIICADNGVPSLSTEQVLTINILQIEDPPQIVLTPVFGFADDASASMVMENSKKGTFVSWLRITNRPSSDDLTITLSPADYFKLESDVIVTTQSFDREKRAMFNLMVTVCETRRIHRCAKSEQTVYVGDVNDNAPVMSREHISMNLREDTPVGQTLLRVRAADADSTYGVLTYSLEQNDEGIFRVDPQSGEIFLARPIDYETKNKYEFITRATDPDGKSAVTVINVTIINVNDNRPKFNLESNQIQISNKHNLNQPVLVINATDADGVVPILKIGSTHSFVLIRNELYLTKNITKTFSEEVQLIVVDGDDPTSVYSELITVEVSRGVAPIVGGVVGAIIIILIVLTIVVKLCAERKYRIYQRGVKQNMDSDDGKRNSRDYLDYQSYHTDTQSEYAKMSIQHAGSQQKNDGRDSGRGDSDSNPDTLTDWCQPECLTLGHSDACWLPANQRYSGQFAVEVGPNTPKHRLEVHHVVPPNGISDRTSDYSSYNSAGEQHAVDNRLSQILSSDVIV